LRVTLINVGFQPGEENLKVAPPFGIMAVGAYLKQAGHEVTLLDWSGEPLGEDKRQALLDSEPDVVGFHVKISTTVHRAMAAGKWAREAGAKIMWGGAGPTIIPGPMAAEGGIDVAVLGEGEVTSAETLEAFEGQRDLKDVAGIAYLDDGRVRVNPRRERVKDINELPMPLWEGLPDLERYFTPLHGRNAVPLVTSRGCPGRCTFCYTKAMWGYRWAALSPERVVGEMQRVMSLDPRIGGFLIIDDLFAQDPRRVRRICELILERGIDIRWNCEIRADLIDPDLLPLMRRAGCRQVLIGVESGSQRILDLVRKDIKVEDTVRACRLLKENGIEIYAMMVNGLPTETEEDIQATERLLKEIRPEFTEFLVYTPYPGTPLFEEAVERGFQPPATLEEWGHMGTFSMKSIGAKRLVGNDGKRYEKMEQDARKRSTRDSYVQAVMKDPLTAPVRGFRYLMRRGRSDEGGDGAKAKGE